MNQETWNTKRKLWHVSGCLSMLPIYMMWRSIDYFTYWLTCVLVLVWLLTGIFLAIDIFRLYRPAANQTFKQLPFYGAILRAHEYSGYNASTYCFLAVAFLLTGLYCGLVSEAILLSSILVMAVADPLAAGVRCIFSGNRLMGARFLGLMGFAVSALLLSSVIFYGYGQVSWLALMTASVITAMIEAYTGSAWQYLKIATAEMHLALPKFIAVIYPDDNFTSPLIFALVLLLFGL